MTLTFVNNPQTPFIVQQVGTMVQIKPFSGYYRWLDWFDIAPLDQSALIDELQDDVDAAAAAAAAAQTTANTGVTNAAAAQTTANAAAAAAAAITVDYPSQHFIIPQSTHVISGGFGSAVVNPAAALNVLYLMNGLNGEVNFKVGVPAGNYVVTLIGYRYNGGADCSLYVDGTLHSMNHFYAAVAVHAVEVNYVVNSLTKGLHTFGLKITGRQPGNTTSYSLYLSYILVRPNP